MKKFIYAAILALVMSSFAGCKPGTFGTEPVINEDKGTIDGIPYDNTTYKCWQVVFKATASAHGQSATSEDYEWVWDTAFGVYSYAAAVAYASSGTIQGVVTKVTYDITEVHGKTENTCYLGD